MEASVYCAHCGALNQPGATTCFACTRPLNKPAPIIDARRMMRDRYWLVRQIGVGGFGAVYQAEDTTLGHRLVAVKEMSPRGLSPQEAQEATDAFQREAILLAGLSHPRLPRIYDRFEEEGRWYLVMDFIEGETLEVYLEKQGGKVPVKEALQIALYLTDVLGYLHSRQPPIIFRDLKPSNIMRTPDGQVLLIDFGIARFFKPGQNKDTIAFGSPGYAAPEQYGKAQTTPRSDIFSLGAVLHQMLTGIDPSEKPFRFAPLTIPCPAGLPDLIEQMVEMEESQRPPAMDVIRRELERMQAESPTSWRAEDLAATGAYISPARASTGALSATDPVMQPAGLQLWPTSQPAKKRHGKVFWGSLVAAAFLIPIVMSGVVLQYNKTHFGHQPTFYQPPATSIPGGSATSTPPATPPATRSDAGVALYGVAWSPDGTRLASGGAHGEIALWDTTDDSFSSYTDTPLLLSTPFTVIKALAWAPDGSMLAAVGDASDIYVWHANGGTSSTYPIDAGAMTALAWSPDNEHLALVGADATLRVADALSGSITSLADTSSSYTDTLNAVAWSPNGEYLACGGIDQRVDIWNYEYHVFSGSYHQENGPIDALAWSPDSKRIVSAKYNAYDPTASLEEWDALTGENVFTYGSDTTPSGVDTVAWSPDGTRIAAGDDTGTINVWRVGDSTPFVAGYRGSPVRAVAWSPNRDWIASISDDGAVQIWDVQTGVNIITYRQP